MATITYILLPSVIKERMALHDNVDDKLIFPEIYNVQKINLLPLLGTTLYNKIINDIANNSLSGYYKSLVDDYLIDIVCNYTMARLAERLNYQLWNKGVNAKTAADTQQANQGETFSVKAMYKNDAEVYMERARLYLIQYANSRFPEYMAVTQGLDTIVPKQRDFTSPIFLSRKNKGNNNRPYNRFTEIYEQ